MNSAKTKIKISRIFKGRICNLKEQDKELVLELIQILEDMTQ
jgi:hypothetical protein